MNSEAKTHHRDTENTEVAQRNLGTRTFEATQTKEGPRRNVGLVIFFYDGLLRSAPFVRLGSLVIVARGRWPVTFVGVGNDNHLLFRRPLIVSFLRECANRDNAQHRYHQ